MDHKKKNDLKDILHQNVQEKENYLMDIFVKEKENND